MLRSTSAKTLGTSVMMPSTPMVDEVALVVGIVDRPDVHRDALGVRGRHQVGIDHGSAVEAIGDLQRDLVRTALDTPAASQGSGGRQGLVQRERRVDVRRGGPERGDRGIVERRDDHVVSAELGQHRRQLGLVGLHLGRRLLDVEVERDVGMGDQDLSSVATVSRGSSGARPRRG